MKRTVTLGLWVVGLISCTSGGAPSNDGGVTASDAGLDGGAPTDSGTSMIDAGAPLDAGIHIQDVQNDAMTVGASVELHGVVVTAVDTFGSKTGDLWVEELSAGPFSGVRVHGAANTSLAIGDVVTISGAMKAELSIANATNTLTELVPSGGGTLVVTKTGTATVPEPQRLDVVAIDGMTAEAREAEYEKWEGVLVSIHAVRSAGFPHGMGARAYADDASEVLVTQTLFVESNLTSLATVDGLTCFASLVGVEDVSPDWALAPRNAGDVVIGNTCTALVPAVTTISAINSTLPTFPVELQNVVVTAVALGRTNFWVSTSATGAANESLFVYQGNTAEIDSQLVPGVRLDLSGMPLAYNDDSSGGTLTQLSPLRIALLPGGPQTIVPRADVTAAQLLQPATAAANESVMVSLTNVKLTALGTAANGFIASASQAGNTFGVATDATALTGTDLGCYQSVIGLWTNLQARSDTAITKPNAPGLIWVSATGLGLGNCN